jgi:hypothetical protein
MGRGEGGGGRRGEPVHNRNNINAEGRKEVDGWAQVRLDVLKWEQEQCVTRLLNMEGYTRAPRIFPGGRGRLPDIYNLFDVKNYVMKIML